MIFHSSAICGDIVLHQSTYFIFIIPIINVTHCYSAINTVIQSMLDGLLEKQNKWMYLSDRTIDVRAWSWQFRTIDKPTWKSVTNTNQVWWSASTSICSKILIKLASRAKRKKPTKSMNLNRNSYFRFSFGRHRNDSSTKTNSENKQNNNKFNTLTRCRSQNRRDLYRGEQSSGLLRGGNWNRLTMNSTRAWMIFLIHKETRASQPMWRVQAH